MSRQRLRVRLHCVAILFLATNISHPQEWTRFRGPNGTGISDAKGIPTKFTEKDFNWKTPLPGMGHSQPVVWGDKVFVTSAPEDGSARSVICVGAKDGAILWKKSFPSKKYTTSHRNSMASSTPTVDADHVYAAFAHPGNLFIVALDHSGNEKWRQGVGAVAGRHGFGASPILFEDMIIVSNEHQRRGDEPEMSSALVALDRMTGDRKWRLPRKSAIQAYGTPCVFEFERGRPELLVTSSGHGVYSVEARTGKPLWTARVFKARSVSSPIVASGLVFGTNGSGPGGKYLVAVRPGGEGDVTDTHLLYEVKNAPYVPTPLAKDGRLYLWSDTGGIVTCIKAASGEEIWKGRVSGNYSGSPVWNEGRLFCISDDGEVAVVSAGDKFEVLARNPLGEPSRGTPAISGGRMYLRTYGHLISVGGRGAGETGSRGDGEQGRRAKDSSFSIPPGAQGARN